MLGRFALAVLAMLGVVTPAVAQQNPTVKIGIYGILAEAGLYIAQERGYFAAEKLNVELVTGAAGPDVLPAFATGEIDATGGSFSPGYVNAAKRGLNMKMTVALSSFEKTGNAGFFMIRPELADKIKDWKDLKGYKVAVSPPRPNLNEYIVERGLEQGGLTLKDVQVVEVPFPTMIAALKSGGVDAAHTAEPMSTAAQDAGAAVKWRTTESYLPGLTPSLLSFGPRLLDRDRDVGERLLAAYLRGARDYVKAFEKNEGRQEVVNILVKYTPVKNPDLYSRMGMSHIDGNGDMNPKVLQDVADFFNKAGVIDKIDINTLMDDSLRQAALKRIGPAK
jgi:NitT/TauT family transport system substrate-binding protein